MMLWRHRETSKVHVKLDRDFSILCLKNKIGISARMYKISEFENETVYFRLHFELSLSETVAEITANQTCHLNQLHS
jgi:hypothetical protein